ncbi:MAG: BamA/TamA family outer membrane protein [Elusimicrobia bacterium]|nr:BamA/TamA family outer membrane protein [Elusimicrobiota bacterium]
MGIWGRGAVFCIVIYALNPGICAGGGDGEFNKVRISESELANKREGRYAALFGGPGYSPDMGFILAGIAGFYDGGAREDRYFGYSPYRSALLLSSSWSTKGMANILADWDAPFFRESFYRIRARVNYFSNPVEQYYGTGEASLEDLTTPLGKSYSEYEDYSEDILMIEDGYTDAYYDFFEERGFVLTANLERSVFKGVSRVTGGFCFSREWIGDYTGEKVPGTEKRGDDDREEALMRVTRLYRDHLAGAVDGFGGGWDNSVRVGFAYDTRDLETYPRQGMFHDAVYTLASGALGSDFDYTDVCVSARWYWSPARRLADAVIASRLLYSVKNGEIPFFAMNTLPATDKTMYGLGGETTLRGFRQSRFTGPVMAAGNLEVRFNVLDFYIGEHMVELVLAPFAEAGSVFDKVENTGLDSLKYSYGVGARTVVSQSFGLSFDFGFSEEESLLFYLNYGIIF